MQAKNKSDDDAVPIGIKRGVDSLRDLDRDGDVDLADDPTRDLDRDGRIDIDDREQHDLDNDNDIDASDHSLKNKSVRQKLKEQGYDVGQGGPKQGQGQRLS